MIETPVTLPMLNMLSSDIQGLLNKYLLQHLMSTYIQNNELTPPSKNTETPNTVFPSLLSPLSINQLILRQRKDLYVPIPRYVHQADCGKKDTENDRRDSISTTKEEVVMPATKSDSEPNMNADRNYQSQTRRAKLRKRTREELRKIKMDLTFDNETGELATRCDVVYKTILRDFRRFFLEEYKIFKQNLKKESDLVDCLFSFTCNLYPNKSVKDCKEISLDLGCLLFPKEMVRDSKAIKEKQTFANLGEHIDEIKSEMLKIHGFLYKFSIDKIEECFLNLSLCELFLTYISKSKDDRINANATMKKNRSIYIKARKILEDKASNSLSLEL